MFVLSLTVIEPVVIMEDCFSVCISDVTCCLLMIHSLGW